MANTHIPFEDMYNNRNRLRRTPIWGHGGEIHITEFHVGHFFNVVVNKFTCHLYYHSKNIYPPQTLVSRGDSPRQNSTGDKNNHNHPVFKNLWWMGIRCLDGKLSEERNPPSPTGRI